MVEYWIPQLVGGVARRPPTSSRVRYVSHAKFQRPRNLKILALIQLWEQVMDRIVLREQLSNYFNLDELHTLCFDLYIDFESLSGESKQAKAREIVAYCERTGQINNLVAAVHRLRPQLSLPDNAPINLKSHPLPMTKQITSNATTEPAVARPVNLSFDAYAMNSWPSGWFNSLGIVHGVSTAYGARVVTRPDDGKGACVVFWDLGVGDTEFGSLMQRCPVHYLAGKAIRLEAEIRTKQVKQWSGLWLRADGEHIPDLLFDNMSRRPIQGSTPWTKYVIDVQLPEETAWLNYGIVLAGQGTIWADNFRLMLWSSSGRWKDV